MFRNNKIVYLLALVGTPNSHYFLKIVVLPKWEIGGKIG